MRTEKRERFLHVLHILHTRDNSQYMSPTQVSTGCAECFSRFSALLLIHVKRSLVQISVKLSWKHRAISVRLQSDVLRGRTRVSPSNKQVATVVRVALK